MGVEQLPPRVRRLALGAVGGERRGRRAERRLVPVGQRARGVVVVEVLGQPLGLAREPGAGGAAAAGLVGALDVERDEVPGAEVVGVPAVAGLAERSGLTLGLRRRLGDDVAGGRVGDRVVDLGAVARVLDAVVVVEVAEAADTRLAVVVVELVVAGRGALEELEGAPVLVEGVLEVRVVAVLVLLVAEHGDEVGLHRLDLLGGRVLRLVAHGRARALIAGVGRLLGLLGRSGLAGDVADRGQHRRRRRGGVRPRVVV